MKVADLQQFLGQLVPFVKAARASETVASEIERAGQCLEPFKEQSIADFAAFLRMADEYVRTGTLPASAKGRRSRSGQAPKPAKLTGAAAAQLFLALYERAADPTLDNATIEVELSKLHDLSIAELRSLAKEVNRSLPANLKKKPDIVAAFKRMIKDQKENYDRTPQPVAAAPQEELAVDPADTL